MISRGLYYVHDVNEKLEKDRRRRTNIRGITVLNKTGDDIEVMNFVVTVNYL